MFGRTASDPFASPCYRRPPRRRRDSIFSPDLVNGAETGSFPPRRPTHALARSPDSQIDTRDREGGRGLGVNVRVEKERERERER